jgi:hypothetical protein
MAEEGRPEAGRERAKHELLRLSEDEFFQLVQDERRAHRSGGFSPDLAWALRQDELLDRWLVAVDRANAELLQRVATLKVELEEASGKRAEHGVVSQDRRRALRALESVKAQRREIKQLIAERNRRLTAQEQQASPYQRALRRLRDAHPQEFDAILAAEEAADLAASTPP